MTVLNPPRSGRHARRRTRGLLYWLALADAVLFVLCVITGAVSPR